MKINEIVFLESRFQGKIIRTIGKITSIESNIYVVKPFNRAPTRRVSKARLIPVVSDAIDHLLKDMQEANLYSFKGWFGLVTNHRPVRSWGGQQPSWTFHFERLNTVAGCNEWSYWKLNELRKVSRLELEKAFNTWKG